MYHAADNAHLHDAIEYIYKEHCCDEQGQQVRRIVGVGLSLGASILGQYAIKAGKNNRLDAQVGIGCSFNTCLATEFIKKSLCGFYDFFLGCSLRVNLAEQFVQYDNLKKKTDPGSNLAELGSRLCRVSKVPEISAR